MKAQPLDLAVVEAVQASLWARTRPRRKSRDTTRIHAARDDTTKRDSGLSGKSGWQYGQGIRAIGADHRFHALTFIRANHLLAVYYLNARLLNVTSKTYRSHPEWAALTQDGPRREQISTEVFHVACPASPGYQRRLENEVLRVAGRYGGDGVQLDQIGAAWSVLCFDKSHGHRTPAMPWAEGHTRLLKQVRSAMRKAKSDFFCWVEGAWEGASQYVDLSQGGFWPDHPGSEPFPEMCRYTLPEHPQFGDARIGGVPYWCPSDIPRARRINAEASAFFWDGEFRDTLGLSIDNDGEAHWFTKGSRVLVTLFNPHDGPREFTVRLQTAQINRSVQHRTAKALASGVEAATSLDAGSIRLSVKVPPRQVEAVVLRVD
jgi:hypothetical protein